MEFYNSFLILMRNKTVKVARSCEIITIAYVPVDFLEEPLFIYLFPIVSRKANFGKWELFFGVSFIAIRKKTTETTHIVCVCVYVCVCVCIHVVLCCFLSFNTKLLSKTFAPSRPFWRELENQFFELSLFCYCRLTLIYGKK